MRGHTLREEVSFSGLGLHRGARGTLHLIPSKKGCITFRFGKTSFDLRESSFQGGGRGTALSFGKSHSLATVETSFRSPLPLRHMERGCGGGGGGSSHGRRKCRLLYEGAFSPKRTLERAHGASLSGNPPLCGRSRRGPPS